MLISSQADNLIVKDGNMIYDPSIPENHTYNGIIVPMEFWAPVTEEMVPNVAPIYYISNLGNLYNIESNKYCNAKIKVGDYIRVLLNCKDGSKRMTTIHRLVCMAFNGLPPGPGYNVDHINCDKTCSIYLNLEWVTVGENNRRAYANNLNKVAEDRYNSLFTNEQVHEICRMLSEGVPINTIASIMEKAIYPKQASYRMTDIIYQTLGGNTYKSISKDYVFHNYSRIHLTDYEVRIACIALVKGKTYDFIIDELLNKKDCDDVERSRLKETLYQIKSGNSFTRISCDYGFTDPEIRKQIMKNSRRRRNSINTDDYSSIAYYADNPNIKPFPGKVLSIDEIRMINDMVKEGKPFNDIILALGPHGINIEVMCIVNNMIHDREGQNAV